MRKNIKGIKSSAWGLMLAFAFASCSSMKQLWDLKGIRVSANDQVYTGKSTTVPMDIKTGNLRFEFNATSDPVDNGYPVSIKVDDSSVVSVTQSASNPSSYTITGLKSGYTAVTASCSSAYTFTFLVFVADTSRGITVDSLKQQRDDDIARLKAEEEARVAAAALAKQQAEEKAAAALAKQQAEEKAAAEALAKKQAEEKAAADALAKKQAEEKAAAEAFAKQQAAAATFAPKAGECYALNVSELKYIYFPTAEEMRMTFKNNSYDGNIGTQYKVKFASNNAKAENGWYFKNVAGTVMAYYNHGSEDAEVYPAENFDRIIYPEGSDPWEEGPVNKPLYGKWHVYYRSSEGGNFARWYILDFSSNGKVSVTGPRYMIEGVNLDDITFARQEVTKTYTYTNTEGFITLQNGETYYHDGKVLRDAFVVKKVTDSAAVSKIKNARWFQPSDEK